MSVIEEALRTLLVNDSAVATAVAGRIYPVVVPAGATKPAIAYQRISGVRENAQDGPPGLAHPRIQYACIAATYAAAKALANDVREALNGYQGTSDGVEIDGIHVQNEIDNYNQEPDSAASTYTTWLDFVVWHHETP